MNSLTLTPEFVEQYLPDCKPGEEKEITLTIKVNAVDAESGLEAEVTEVSYAEPEEETDETEEMEEVIEEEVKPKSKRPAAVVAVLTKK